MFKKIFSRKTLIVVLIICMFSVLGYRLFYLTVLKGEEYRKKADDSFLKREVISAKRGEIYDRNGVLLAGNKPSYTVKFLNNPKISKDINKIAVKILTLLESKNEKYLEFPIIMINNEFYYRDDLIIKDWLRDNDFPLDSTAEYVFNSVRKREYIDDLLNDYDAQKMLLYRGITLPISVRNMEYTQNLNKNKFLEYYGLDKNISAKEAFLELKNKKSFRIKEDISDADALKIMIIRDALSKKKYLSYIPIVIAEDVSKETAILIEELNMDFPGVFVEVETERYYPFSNSAAHIIGYMGRISSQKEKEKYNSQSGYKPSDLIGKTGLENSYEDVLHGEDGYKYIYADANGNYIGDFIKGIEGKENKEAISGNKITTSFDINFQKKVELYLKYGLDKISRGEVYRSPFGDYEYKKFENAKSGAVVVVDVKTGEILALANYPSYDLNLFSTGITMEDWKKLQPENPKNPLSPRPLYNIATNTAVQPGSTFKPITVLAALEQGLKPNQKLFTKGAVEVGKHLYRCWYYRAPYHGIHGSINAKTALEVSCNYFMYDIVRGYDYSKNKPLNFTMNTDILLSYMEMLGLGEKSGVEIYEKIVGLPSEEIKKRAQLLALKRFLNKVLENYYDPEKLKDEKYKDNIINTILSYVDDYLTGNLTRGELIKRLMSFEDNLDLKKISLLADYVYFSYFKQIPWREGDDLNLSIGQGDHRYTPLQIARYLTAISNGGYLHELTLIKDSNKKTVQLPLKNPKNLDAIKEGMYLVANGKRGSAKKVFRDFPIKVGAKTGTAQASGRIPPKNELEFIREIFPKIKKSLNKGIRKSDKKYITITEQELEDQTKKILEERNKEIAELQIEYNNLEDGIEKKELEKKISRKARGKYLDEGYIMKEILLNDPSQRITNDIINEYRSEYDPFTWFISFAPYKEPEIAVVVLIPQGGSGGYAAPIVRDIYAEYFSLNKDSKNSRDFIID